MKLGIAIALVIALWSISPSRQARAQSADLTGETEASKRDRSSSGDRQTARAQFQMGLSGYWLGHFEEALQHFKAAQSTMSSPTLDLYLGMTCWRLCRRRVAIAYFRRYVRERPTATNRLAVETAIERLESGSKARVAPGGRLAVLPLPPPSVAMSTMEDVDPYPSLVEARDSAIESDTVRAPDPARTQFEAGRSALQLEMFDAALRRFESANTLRPSPVLHYYLGVAYERLCVLEAALDHYPRYLSQYGSAPHREDVERGIARLEEWVHRGDYDADEAEIMRDAAPTAGPAEDDPYDNPAPPPPRATSAKRVPRPNMLVAMGGEANLHASRSHGSMYSVGTQFQLDFPTTNHVAWRCTLHLVDGVEEEYDDRVGRRVMGHAVIIDLLTGPRFDLFEWNEDRRLRPFVAVSAGTSFLSLLVPPSLPIQLETGVDLRVNQHMLLRAQILARWNLPVLAYIYTVSIGLALAVVISL